jgi:anti-sigma B factor antagonist
MKLHTQEYPYCTRIHLTGQFLNHQQVVDIEELLQGLLFDNRTNIVIDFTEISYISSNIIGLLVKLNFDIKEKGGRLVLIGVNKIILDVFRLTKIDETLVILTSDTDLENYFSNQ